MPETPRTITLLFKPDGSAEVATAGFAGKECQAASAPYEAALGTKTAETITAEGRAVPATVQATAQVKHRTG